MHKYYYNNHFYFFWKSKNKIYIDIINIINIDIINLIIIFLLNINSKIKSKINQIIVII